MADTRLIPTGINDERARILASQMDGPGSIDLVPLLVNHFKTSPASALPYLVEQFALKEFTTDDMPELAVRRLLEKAFLLHRFRGTRFAVEEALSVVGINAEIVEWFEEGGTGEPYTFQVTAYVTENMDEDGQPLLNEKTLARAYRLINASKRHSLAYELRLAVRFDTTLHMAAAVSSASHSAKCIEAAPAPTDIKATPKMAAILSSATIHCAEVQL